MNLLHKQSILYITCEHVRESKNLSLMRWKFFEYNGLVEMAVMIVAILCLRLNFFLPFKNRTQLHFYSSTVKKHVAMWLANLAATLDDSSLISHVWAKGCIHLFSNWSFFIYGSKPDWFNPIAGQKIKETTKWN
jgi:hypothetical protein